MAAMVIIVVCHNEEVRVEEGMRGKEGGGERERERENEGGGGGGGVWGGGGKLFFFWPVLA